MDDFESAKDKIMMGAERRSMVMNEEEKLNTAYHESGHAVVAKLVPKSDPVHKVTIIPRGRALGMVIMLFGLTMLAPLILSYVVDDGWNQYRKNETQYTTGDDLRRNGSVDGKYGVNNTGFWQFNNNCSIDRSGDFENSSPLIDNLVYQQMAQVKLSLTFVYHLYP